MSSILPIISYKEPNLRKVSQPVHDVKDPHIQGLIDDMTYTMYAKDGVGLASSQVDVPYRVFVIVPDPSHFDACKKSGSEALAFINPVILRHSILKESGEEGCLSIPNIFGMVKRWKSITISYTDRHGKKSKLKTSGLLARVIQHEIDHLDGILFTDRADSLRQVQQL